MARLKQKNFGNQINYYEREKVIYDKYNRTFEQIKQKRYI